MLGPGVVWYLGISAFLFGTGALGVLIRRNPLIVLLSLEIMLNGANLALIAFSRSAGNGAGQIFALAVESQPAARREIRFPQSVISSAPASGDARQSQAPTVTLEAPTVGRRPSRAACG